MTKVIINFPDDSHFSISQTVRIQDVNYRKHLGHDKLISMIHDARAAFFETIGVSELEDSSLGYILADLQIAYLDEAFFGDILSFKIYIADVSKRSCQMLYRITKRTDKQAHPTLIAQAKTGVVFYDYELRKATAIPEKLKRYSSGSL